MSAHLITLQDYDVGIYAPDAVLARSPGFASIANDTPVFGAAARELARLHPRQSFNQFWTQLSLDPLGIKNKHFRHTADLAHGHLQALTAGLTLDKDTVIAVPSNYTRNQMSVLLGIARTCDIPVHGLVDLALLQAMASDSGADNFIILDLQLHQAVLTSFQRVNGEMQRDRVIQVPATGLLALQDAWTNMIADEFIRQTRFDPKHNAEIEQYMYNQLDQWLVQGAAAGELLIDIKHKGSLHQARVTHPLFAQRARVIFERISKELEQLTTADTAVHVLGSQLLLPGLTAALPGIIALDDALLLDSFLGNLQHIRTTPEQVQFVTRLPVGQRHTSTAATALPPRLPTHVLVENKAISLPQGRLVFGATPADGNFVRVLPLELAVTPKPEPQDETRKAAELLQGSIILDRSLKQLRLELRDLDTVLLNGSVASSGALLALGDCLQIGAITLRLIQVE